MFITIPILIIIVRVMMMMMINTPKKADHVIFAFAFPRSSHSPWPWVNMEDCFFSVDLLSVSSVLHQAMFFFFWQCIKQRVTCCFSPKHHPLHWTEWNSFSSYTFLHGTTLSCTDLGRWTLKTGWRPIFPLLKMPVKDGGVGVDCISEK